jgi:mono/diheme cytochrome c family protein
VFTENCSSCHAGGGNVVDRRFALKDSRHLGTAADFTSFIRAPKMPDGSEGAMPPFPKDQLSDAQAGDLYEYVRGMLPSWK